MAMPASGCIGIIACPNGVACSSIAQAVDGNVTPPKSLAALSVTAGLDGCMSDFYGYSASSGSISLTTNESQFTSESELIFNTISASGAWSASKVDPDGIIDSFSASGSGSGKVIAGSSSDMPAYITEACIIYCLNSSPLTRTCWTLVWIGVI
jgi:hypothetical protein